MTRESTGVRSGPPVSLEHGFRKIDFVGMGPIANEKLETAIFYRSGNCLGI